MNVPWKKALREIFGRRTESERTRLFRAVWRSQLERMAKISGVPSQDNTEEMIAYFKREGVDEGWMAELKLRFQDWQQERDKAQRRAASNARWHPKSPPVKKSLGARLKARK